VRRHSYALALFLLALALSAYGFEKDKEDPNVRSVHGTVFDAKDNAVEGAVVKLKNSRTLQVRSFITQQDGSYYFHGLSTNVDYELKAEHRGASSQSKTLSIYDSRKKALIHLRLESGS